MSLQLDLHLQQISLDRPPFDAEQGFVPGLVDNVLGTAARDKPAKPAFLHMHELPEL